MCGDNCPWIFLLYCCKNGAKQGKLKSTNGYGDLWGTDTQF